MRKIRKDKGKKKRQSRFYVAYDLDDFEQVVVCGHYTEILDYFNMDITTLFRNINNENHKYVRNKKHYSIKAFTKEDLKCS